MHFISLLEVSLVFIRDFWKIVWGGIPSLYYILKKNEIVHITEYGVITQQFHQVDSIR